MEAAIHDGPVILARILLVQKMRLALAVQEADSAAVAADK